ncbi:MAG: hypothetical protein OXF33_09440 [Rhodospirillales bacterium]|nr:hypothetical protein [Rhodospirillales bacterium]
MTGSTPGSESKATVGDEAHDIAPAGLRNASAGDGAGAEVFENDDDARSTARLIAGFVAAWSERKQEQAEVWLADEFRRFPGIWNGEQESDAAARDIVASIDQANASKQSLQAHLDAGKSKPSWTAAAIEKGATAAGTTNIGDYAANVETALEEANAGMLGAVQTQGGNVSMAPNLDGFIAERHHAATFNLDAAAKGSSLRAEVLEPEPGQPFAKNSVDIVIKDGNDPVRRYQAKFGRDANATRELFKDGNYQGQRKLVPSGQENEISGATDTIEMDGVHSKPLTKEEAKARQEEFQRRTRSQEGQDNAYDWNDVSRIEIAKAIGKQALISAAVSIGLQGVRILARRAWNWLRNTENPPPNKDLREYFDASVRSATHVGEQVAVSGAVMVAAKQGLIKGLQRTPPGAIANIVFVGMENARVLYKFATGQLSAEEALDAAGNATCSAVGALVGAGKGAILGTMASGPLAPVGAFVGGVAGAMAGSKIGEAVYEGGKTIVKTAVKVAQTLYEGAAEAIQKAGRVLNPLNWAG